MCHWFQLNYLASQKLNSQISIILFILFAILVSRKESEQMIYLTTNKLAKVASGNFGWNVQSWLTLAAIIVSVVGLIFTISSPYRKEGRIKKEANKNIELLDYAITHLENAKNANIWGTTVNELILAKSNYISFAIVSKSHGVNVETDPIEKQIDAFLALGAKPSDDNALFFFRKDAIDSMTDSLVYLKDSYK